MPKRPSSTAFEPRYASCSMAVRRNSGDRGGELAVRLHPASLAAAAFLAPRAVFRLLRRFDSDPCCRPCDQFLNGCVGGRCTDVREGHGRADGLLDVAFLKFGFIGRVTLHVRGGCQNRCRCGDECIHGGGVGNGLVSEQVSDLSLDDATFVVPLSLCSLLHPCIRSVQSFLQLRKDRSSTLRT